MSLRSEVKEELRQAAESAVSGLIGAIEAELLRRRAAPCYWHAFHSRMAARLRPIRWAARLHHKRRALRYETLCDLEQRSGNPIACAYCPSPKTI